MAKFIAIADVECGGHYITCHEFREEPGNLDSALKIWMGEMHKEIGFTDDLQRLREQECVTQIDGMDFVGRASFTFGDEYEHCMLTLVIK